MLVESVGSALLISKLQGGKLGNLVNVHIKKWWLFTGAAFIEFSASIIRAREIEPLWRWLDNNVLWLQLASYGLLIAGLLYNRKWKGIRWILIGVVLNFVVIMANGGRMPVEVTGFDPQVYHTSLETLASGKDLTHGMANESTRLLFLADIIHLKKPYPLPKSLSIGDVLMMMGVFFYVRSQVLGKN